MREKIKAIWEKNELYYEYDIFTNNVVNVYVDFGDWKHDHAYIDYLMCNNGFELVEEKLTYSDGSDCYSSVHIYKYRG